MRVYWRRYSYDLCMCATIDCSLTTDAIANATTMRRLGTDLFSWNHALTHAARREDGYECEYSAADERLRRCSTYHRLRVRIYITLHCIFSGDFIGSICISFYRSLGVFCYFTVPAFYGFQRYTKCCMCVNSSQVVYNNIYRVMLFWGNYCVVSMTMVWCEEFCENCFRVDCLVLCFVERKSDYVDDITRYCITTYL